MKQNNSDESAFEDLGFKCVYLQLVIFDIINDNLKFLFGLFCGVILGLTIAFFL